MNDAPPKVDIWKQTADFEGNASTLETIGTVTEIATPIVATGATYGGAIYGGATATGGLMAAAPVAAALAGGYLGAKLADRYGQSVLDAMGFTVESLRQSILEDDPDLFELTANGNEPGLATLCVAHEQSEDGGGWWAWAKAIGTGIVAGALVVGAVALTVGTGGIAGAVIVGAVAGAAGGFAGKAVANREIAARQGIFKNEGTVVTGSSNVTFEDKPVARFGDMVQCAKCGKPPHENLIHEGSLTVSVNQRPLARIGHHAQCGAIISQGAKTVLADLTTGASGGHNIGSTATAITKSALGLGMAAGGGFLGGYGAAKNGLVPTKGDPVDIIRGTYSEYWSDFQIDGTIVLTGARYYSTQLKQIGPLGRNRSTFLDEVICEDESGDLHYVQADGTQIRFKKPESGSSSFNLSSPHLEMLGFKENAVLLRDKALVRTFQKSHDGMYRTVEIIDGNSNIVYFDRDENGLLQQIRHCDGFSLQFTSNSQGLRKTVDWIIGDQILRLANYDYDEQANLVRVSCATADTLYYTYDEKNRLTSWYDGLKRARSDYFYDENDRVVSTKTSGPWNNDIFEYDREARITRYYPGGGDACQATYLDEFDNVICEENELGEKTTFSYNEVFQKTAIIDANGNKQTFRYDDFGNIKQSVDSEGRVNHYSWTRTGKLLQHIDAEGNIWHYDYDQSGNLKSVKNPLGHETALEWSLHGELAAIYYADGSIERRSYDKYHRLIGIKHPNGGETRLTRDLFGRILARQDPSGAITRYDYGQKYGNDFYTPAAIIRPDGVCIRQGFDSEGKRTSLKDGEGREWSYHYGPFDQLIAIEEPGGGRLAFEYDILQRLTRVHDALGKDWLFERDASGKVIKETDFSGQSIAYNYDKVGNVIKRVNADGSTIEYSYDKTGLLCQEIALDAQGVLEDQTRYQYDKRALLASAQNTASSIALIRDANGQIVEEHCNGKAINNTFGPMGQRLQRQIGDNIIKQSFDPLGALQQLQINDHSPLEITRDIMGREIARQTSAGFCLTQSFDPLGQLKQQKAGLSLSSLGSGFSGLINAQKSGIAPQEIKGQVERHYQWNKAFEPLEIADNRWGKTAYHYDKNGQINEASFADGTAEHFRYDPAKNIVGFGEGNGIVEQWQTQTGGRISDAKGPNGERITLTYDVCNRVIRRKVARNGFRTKTWVYEWDAKDRLIAAITPEGTRWLYRYDAFGRRIAKINADVQKAALYQAPVEQNIGAYYEEKPRHHQTDQSPNPVIGISYLWDGHVMVAEAPLQLDETTNWNKATTWYYQEGSFIPLAKRDATGDLYYIVADHLGTPREMFSEDGHLVWAAQYRTWGGIKHIWKAENDNDAIRGPYPPVSRGALAIQYETVEAVSAQDCPIRFQGQWEDAETGLYYNRYRYYDPLVGQYMCPDPLGLGGGTRPQGYVHNPNAWIDPFGLAAYTNGVPLDNAKLWGPHEDGPLGNPNNSAEPASTFRSGSYTEGQLANDIVLHRAVGGSAKDLGQFWTPLKPSGPLQAQLDSALLPSWGNTAEGVYSATIPRGTTVYVGAAGPQSMPMGSGTIYGGGPQVYIPWDTLNQIFK